MPDLMTIGVALPPAPVAAPATKSTTAPDFVAPVQRADDKEVEPAPQALAQALEEIAPQPTNVSRLSIEHDAFVQAFVYRSVDKETGEVVDQYPGDDQLKLRRYMREIAGLVVDEMA